ncbi:hypothetical protein D1604_05015 [Brevundimonas sp. LPMIX5]|nr:hypothetical protein D1604_05015 [Brevundimonas sp. LPMIX5]
MNVSSRARGIGLAAQHDAAEVLEKEAGVPSKTHESVIGSIEGEVICLDMDGNHIQVAYLATVDLIG